MVLGKLPVLGRSTDLDDSSGQGPTAFIVDAGGGCLDIFTSSIIQSLFFLPFSGRRPDTD